MSGWTFSGIKRAIGGRWLARAPESEEAEVTGVSVDSRTLEPGNAFFAIRGARLDGHAFMAQAIERGASMIVVDDTDFARQNLRRATERVPILDVRHSTEALGSLAAAHRRTLDDLHVLTVCGSNGKTTTVRLLDRVLGESLPGSASPKSLNNEIGLPLTVLGARKGHEYLVCEAGCNAPGEIAVLGAIAQPDTVIVTSVGRAHMENFDSVDDVAREDAAMFKHLRRGGAVIIPAGVPVLDDHSKPVPHVVRIGMGPGADLCLAMVEHVRLDDGRLGLRAQVKGGPLLELPFVGKHNALHASMALAAGRRMGLSDEAMARSMRDAEPAEFRLEERHVGGVSVLLDCYNANPESMRSALETFSELSADPAQRVLILGDMLELGEIGPEAHREIGRLITERCEARMIVTIGPLALLIAEEVSRVNPRATFMMHPELTIELTDQIAAEIREGDRVLLKGSRGVRLERVLLALERRLVREKRLSAA